MSPSLTVIIEASKDEVGKRNIADKITPIFESAGLHARITLVRSSDELIAATRRAVTEPPRTIVAGGGDGTVNAVASTLVGTDIPLGILPIGTLNHFAKDLSIPLDVEAAARNIIAGHIVKVDVGEVNEHIFLNNSSLGVYPRIVRYREFRQERFGLGKWPAFAWAAATVLRHHSFLRTELHMNGEKILRRTPFVFIGNNKYEMDGFKMAERSRLNAGQLSVVMPRHTGRWGLLRLTLRGLFGRVRQARDFDVFSTTDMVIETRQRMMDVAMDGEVMRMNTPLRYRMRPGALRVIVPEDAGSR